LSLVPANNNFNERNSIFSFNEKYDNIAKLDDNPFCEVDEIDDYDIYAWYKGKKR
jgi:hypothetical protein